MEKTLYLHWGPGGNAQAELKSFNDHFSPSFVLWNQPTVSPEAKEPYGFLIEATLDQVSKIYAETRTPLHLFGHSFGAHLALEAARRLPEKVRKISLVSPLYSLSLAYRRLGTRLAEIYGDETLATATRQFEKNPAFQTFLPLFQQVTGRPDFMNQFWGSAPESVEARNRFLKAIENTPILHVETFLSVIKNVFDSYSTDEYRLSLTPPATLETEVHLGKEDPYVLLDEDVDHWRQWIPHAKIVTYPVGHFIPLEIGKVWA